MMALISEIFYLPIIGRNQFLQKLFCFDCLKNKHFVRNYNGKAKVCWGGGGGYPIKSEKDHGGENLGSPSIIKRSGPHCTSFIFYARKQQLTEVGEVNRMSIWGWKEELASPVFPHIPTPVF